MFTRFKYSYYNDEHFSTPLTYEKFLSDYPMFLIDCSRQNESVQSSTVDIRVEMEFLTNVPASTAAYLLIIHEKLIEYNPLTSIVQKIV